VNVVLANCSSTRALDLLKRGLVHVAGTHLGKATTLRGARFSVYAYAVWEEGFVVAPGNPKKIRSAEDLRNARIRIINREEGAGSRVLLDRELRRAGVGSALVKGYDTFAAGHLAGAWYVKAGMADCCVAPRAAARAFQLDFVPLATERYELVLPARRGAENAIVKLMDAINGVALRRQLSAIAGYDTSQTGKQIQ
jgi:molybdate-binding protein